MQYYLDGLLDSDRESDTYMGIYNKTNGREVFMAAPNVTTVRMNPAFYNNSQICI